jgi:hypothetical protein
VSIAGCGLHLEDTVLDGQDADIEYASAHVVDQDVLLATALLVQAVGNGRGSRLVDDTKHIHARDGAYMLGGLALRVIEVGRHGDDRIIDLQTQVGLGSLLHLQQDHGPREAEGRGSQKTQPKQKYKM